MLVKSIRINRIRRPGLYYKTDFKKQDKLATIAEKLRLGGLVSNMKFTFCKTREKQAQVQKPPYWNTKKYCYRRDQGIDS